MTIDELRTLAVVLPLAALAGAIPLRRPWRRERAAAVLAGLWCLATLPLVDAVARRLGLWTFAPAECTFLGAPVALILGWAILWGPLAALVPWRAADALVLFGALAIDMIVMPLVAPVVVLGPAWLAGEALALGVVLLPARLLARWTAAHQRTGQRAALQAIAFVLMVFVLAPQVAFELRGGAGFAALATRPTWLLSIVAQLLAVPAILGLSAVQELAERGRGTPVPFDPPRRIVLSGAYAYVRNPMQLAVVVALAGWGALLGSPWVLAGALVALIYSAGIASWDEDEDLRLRFGRRWSRYRRHVRAWIPRLRPWHVESPPARLYIASGCDPCSRLGAWLLRRDPIGLGIVPAEHHASRDLERMTYDPGDGRPEAAGVVALGRALEHLHLGWALAGMTLRLPVMRSLAQLIADGLGFGPMRVTRCDLGRSPMARRS